MKKKSTQEEEEEEGRLIKDQFMMGFLKHYSVASQDEQILPLCARF